MNFFQHQDSARKKTGLLVLFLLLAVISLVAITVATLGTFVYFLGITSTTASLATAQEASLVQHLIIFAQTKNALLVALSVASVVGMGVAFKYNQLSGGGRKVAESLGGKLLSYDASAGQERVLLNVVDEMAIASGNPVPPVYVLEDDSINAFAAGLSRRDAVIGITRGCINLLNRDELQGVIAHEFSHIHNGDMRLNTRLVAVLHGILVIGLIGYFIFRSAGGGYAYGGRHYGHRSYGRSRAKGAGAQMGLGLALIAVGYGGTFFGNIIKAAVSRQREFLADASAVQYTRNPTGIGNALKKIGGFSEGSLLSSGAASQFSHMYFGQGVKTSFTALMATHPPLHERIRRVLPSWNGGYIHPESTPSGAATATPKAAAANTAQFSGSTDNPTTSHTTTSAQTFSRESLSSIGEPQHSHLQHAQNLIDSIPQNLRDAAHQPFSARALIYCLLLDGQKDLRSRQLSRLKDTAHPATFRVMQNLYRYVFQLPREQHIVLIEMSIPALKLLSKPQYAVFKQNMIELIQADKTVNLFEWCVFRIVRNSTEAQTPKPLYTLKQLHTEISLLFSLVVHAGNNVSPGGAFQAGIEALGFKNIKFRLDSGQFSFPQIDRALENLASLKTLQKPRFLKALALVIAADGKVTAAERELYRAVANTLDCPVPPLLGEQH